MRGFHTTADGISIRFGAEDAQLLADLATQIATLIADRDDHASDPALDRLFPAAYRENDADAAEFRRFTEEELADDKVSSALSMARALEAPATDGKVSVTLDPAAAVGWLRSFTDIRLALAARLGIQTEDSVIADDDASAYTFAIYNWLGELQFSLVHAVDR
jgi:Domain of unknown function (DUF2017)